MKKNNLYILFSFFAALFVTSCSNYDENFSNKGYLSAGINKVQNLFIKPTANDEVRTLDVSIAKPEPSDLSFKFIADASSLSTYNTAYSSEAILLPEENYEITNAEVTIKAGAVRSNEASVSFNNITSLDRELIYVLPVRVTSGSIALLESATVTYYVFKGAALINVVADIEKNYLQPTWKNASVANGLKTLTLEALIRARDFNNGEISTIMGIEGNFLIRLGDANFERNQVQLATSGGNCPDRDSSKGLPTNKWVHIAVTFDAGNVEIFIDGKLQSSGRVNKSSVNLGVGGKDGFYVGRSYNDDRWLNGDISECRIWNKVRTQEEIASSIYGVAPDSEGLVSYWKFDEGAGNDVKDHTVNGNDLTSKETLKWKQVALPEE